MCLRLPEPGDPAENQHEQGDDNDKYGTVHDSGSKKYLVIMLR
jgi:hypothetical protein